MRLIRPRVFIVSSTQCALLANALAAELDGPDLEAISWYLDEERHNTQLLTHLIERSRTFDFAVVILSGDDGRDAMAHLAQEGLSPADLARKIASIKVTAYKPT